MPQTVSMNFYDTSPFYRAALDSAVFLISYGDKAPAMNASIRVGESASTAGKSSGRADVIFILTIIKKYSINSN